MAYVFWYMEGMVGSLGFCLKLYILFLSAISIQLFEAYFSTIMITAFFYIHNPEMVKDISMLLVWNIVLYLPFVIFSNIFTGATDFLPVNGLGVFRVDQHISAVLFIIKFNVWVTTSWTSDFSLNMLLKVIQILKSVFHGLEIVKIIVVLVWNKLL